MDKKEVISLLKENLVPAFGCTDPVTPALAAATLKEKMDINDITDLRSIELIVSNDIYKGAFSVVVPGTSEKGLPFAVALGITCGDAGKGLMVLENCDQEAIDEALKLVERGIIDVKPDSTKSDIYIRLIFDTASSRGEVIFNGRHDKVDSITIGEETENYNADTPDTDMSDDDEHHEDVNSDITFITLDEWIGLIEQLDEDDLTIIAKGIELTDKATDAGLTGSYGDQIGKYLFNSQSYDKSTIVSKMKINATAAGDARMGGAKAPLMSVFGSGNQGALIFSGLNELGKYDELDPIKIKRSIALSCLIAGQLNQVLSDGTPFCDCALIAATAASMGMVYLSGGDPAQMDHAAQMTISSMAGLLCDGAKANCAQRISLGAGTAYENSVIAMDSLDFTPEGILGSDYLKSCKTICDLGKKIKVETEEVIVSVLNNKEGNREN